MSLNESKKHLAALLAEKVYSEGNDFAKLLSSTGLVSTEFAELAAPSIKTPNKDLIGVWKKDPKTGDFVRDVEQSADWNYWAQLPVLKTRKTRKRVVLIGESVARGMLCDPAYTPAQVLSQMLNSQLSGSEVEVIDLARTNADIDIVEELVTSCRQISPDAIIIFAGNNWVGNLSYLKSVDSPYEISEEIKSSGIQGFRGKLESALRNNVERLIDMVNAQQLNGVPEICWVVPEFNLGDWRDPDINVHWLDGEGDNEKWLSLRKEADALLGRKELDSCIEIAKQMLKLDGGNCSATAYILADCYKELGDHEQCRQYLEIARDASVIDLSRSYTPRITRDIGDLIKAKAAEYKNKLVDLREVFKPHAEQGIPGRELFLDYCHLTSKGIKVAMSEVAREFAPSMLGRVVTAEKFLSNAPDITAKDDADAHLLAAIHNAHWGQNFDVVSYYCKQAAQKSKDVLSIMKIIVDLQNKRIPIWMNGAIADEVYGLSPQVMRYLFSMSTSCLDELLFDAFSTCCSQYDVPLGKHISDIQLEQHSVSKVGKIDMLDPYFHNTSFSEQQLIEGGFNNRNDYYKAYMASSQFCFFTDAVRPHELKVTLKSTNKPDKAVIKVNGQEVKAIEATKEWLSVSITLDEHILVKGANQVSVEWPECSLDSKKQLEQVCNDINGHLLPEIYPIYGNIYSLSVF